MEGRQCLDLTTETIGHRQSIASPGSEQAVEFGVSFDLSFIGAVNSTISDRSQKPMETMADRKARLEAWKEQKSKVNKIVASKPQSIIRPTSTYLTSKTILADKPANSNFGQCRQAGPLIGVGALPETTEQINGCHCSTRCPDLGGRAACCFSKRETAQRIPLQARPNRRESSEEPKVASRSSNSAPPSSISSTATMAQGSGGCDGDDDQLLRYELLQAELLQWQYANFRLEQSFAAREAKARQVLRELWDTAREQSRRVAQHRTRLERARLLAAVDESLQRQSSAMAALGGPGLPSLQSMAERWEQLAAAARAGAARLPLDGLRAPDPAEAAACLEACEGLLQCGSGGEEDRRLCQAAAELGEAASGAADAAAAAAAELAACEGLLGEVARAGAQERSLAAHLLHALRQR